MAGKSAAAAKKADGAAKPSERVFATNRKAFHDYHILESLEAGIELTGTEIKSVRAGKVNLRDGYGRVQNGEVWLYNVHVSPYEQGNRWNHEPDRPRRLLLHKGEIARLGVKSKEEGLTLVPLRMYAKRGNAKVELAVVRGKKQYDKRATIADRDARRELDRVVKEAYARGR
ncbi:MAG: SsrA-binding protein SmpB [Chloroflexi bacterium]|nr:SsrA-binding protein SmpB [Chloroflexota bacterium]